MKIDKNVKAAIVTIAFLAPLIIVLGLILAKHHKSGPYQFKLKVTEKCLKRIEDLSNPQNPTKQEGPVTAEIDAVLTVSKIPAPSGNSERSYEIRFQKLDYVVELTPGNQATLSLVPGKASSMKINNQSSPLPEDTSKIFDSVFTLALAPNGKLEIVITAGPKADAWQKLGLDPFTILSMSFFGAQLGWDPGAINTFMARLSQLPDGALIPISTSVSQGQSFTASFSGQTNGIQSHLYPGQIPLVTRTTYDVVVSGKTDLNKSSKDFNRSAIKIQLNSNTETSNNGELIARMSIKDYQMNLAMEPF